MNNDTIETEELNEKAEKVDKAEDAADVIKEHEEIPRTKRKGFISVPYHQEKVFNRFCKKRKVYEVAKQVQNPQEQNCLQNQRFEAYKQAPRLLSL